MTDEELVAVLMWRGSALQEGAFFAAADRIEQLTAERDQWIAHTKNAVWADSEELKLAEAERDRLREALTDLHKQALMLRGEQAYREFARAVEKQSRAALKGESHD